MKHLRHNFATAPVLTKHQREMQKLRELHKEVMTDPAKVRKVLIGSGVFVEKPNGEVAVAEVYQPIFQHAV